MKVQRTKQLKPGCRTLYLALAKRRGASHSKTKKEFRPTDTVQMAFQIEVES